MDATEQPNEKGIKAAFDPGSQNSVRISNIKNDITTVSRVTMKTIGNNGHRRRRLARHPAKIQKIIEKMRGDRITEQTINTNDRRGTQVACDPSTERHSLPVTQG